MNVEAVHISREDAHKLLSSGSGDAALLYIYIHSGNVLADAAAALRLNETRLSCAEATLRQLGLWPEERRCPIQSGERPSYSEQDVLEAMNTDGSFRLLYGEVQSQLGRSLNTEELKILLGFIRYLGLSGEVISVLGSNPYASRRVPASHRGRVGGVSTVAHSVFSSLTQYLISFLLIVTRSNYTLLWVVFIIIGLVAAAAYGFLYGPDKRTFPKLYQK